MNQVLVRGVLLFVATAALLFAGCAAKPNDVPPSGSPVPTEPVVTQDTGAIAGIVVNDEVLPIGGAQLLVKELEKTTVSDAQGRFAVNGVPPGQYTMFVSAIGYRSGSARVEVFAGQVTEKSFTLPSVVVGVPYHESLPFTGRFECSGAFFDILWMECPAMSQVAPESQSFIQFTKPEGVTYIVAELRWTQASAGTGQNLDFNLVEQGRDSSQWYANVYGPAPLKIVIEVGKQFENPASPGGGVGSRDFDRVVDDEDIDLQLDLYSSPVYTDQLVTGSPERAALVGITLQQTFQGYVTLFYNEVPAEDFSAFPDA